jgi:hypothetical protein
VIPKHSVISGVFTTMDNRIATIVLLGSLALPATALGEPTQNDRTNAAQECRLERGNTAAERKAFRQRFGKHDTFGKCVSRRAHEEAAERRSARSNAAKECRALHPKGGGNAFGKCVSERARQKKAEADRRDRQEIRRRHRAARS